MRFLFISITNLFFLFNTVFSQQSSKIYGSINDEENNPLIGINIYNMTTIKGIIIVILDPDNPHANNAANEPM